MSSDTDRVRALEQAVRTIKILLLIIASFPKCNPPFSNPADRYHRHGRRAKFHYLKKSRTKVFNWSSVPGQEVFLSLRILVSDKSLSCEPSE